MDAAILGALLAGYFLRQIQPDFTAACRRIAREGAKAVLRLTEESKPAEDELVVVEWDAREGAQVNRLH